MDTSDPTARNGKPLLAAPFRKDPVEESFLDELNTRLACHQEAEYLDLPESFPTLHVVGPPRSGTTLLIQLLAAHLDIGYINNLIAAFWRAPVTGIRLSQKLVPRPEFSRFISKFGRTDGVAEPHEFGYFWRELLGYGELAEPQPGHEETIDWIRVRRVLVNLTHAFEAPVAFKSFLAGWHATRLCNELPRTCLVQIRRDPTETAASLYGMRKNFGGSIDLWTSLKPAEYSWLKNEPVWDQLAGQVHFLEKRFDEQVASVNPRQVLSVEYARLCRDPRGVLGDIVDLFAAQGTEVQTRGTPPRTFNHSTGPELSPEQRQLLAAAIQRFYGPGGRREVA